MDNQNKIITFRYKFIFSEGAEKEFFVKLDKNSLDLIKTKKDTPPRWTELKSFRCKHCPLDGKQHTHCPVAVNLADLVEFFRDSISYNEVYLLIESEDRNYSKLTTLQQGISSLAGIYMVTSGCPIMEKLKPMVRFHLPFATIEETEYRAISMYLLAQYLLHRKGLSPDWEMKNLVKIYDDVKIVNRNFCQKLSEIHIQDAVINALAKLDLFAQNVNLMLIKDKLDEIELLFKPYFK